MMLVAASHISEPPYLAVTVGPSSHSPPPMAEALSTTPGPIIARMFRQPMRGVSISSPVFQGGMADEPGWGAVNGSPVVGGAARAGARSWVMRGAEEGERGTSGEAGGEGDACDGERPR